MRLCLTMPLFIFADGDVYANVYAYVDVYVYENVYVYVCASTCNAKSNLALQITRCLLSSPHMLSALIPMSSPIRGSCNTH